jgi:hypothetical protein
MVSKLLGYPEAALPNAAHALNDAREIGHAATLMYALFHASFPHIWCGNYAMAKAIADELIALADERAALFWKVHGMRTQGQLLAVTHEAVDAIDTITSALTAWRSTGSTTVAHVYLSYLKQFPAYLNRWDSQQARNEGVSGH